MSKRDILRTVRSKKMRKDFEYMSRSEILVRIEKMQQSARYLSEKFGVDRLLHTHQHIQQQQQQQQQQQHLGMDPYSSSGQMGHHVVLVHRSNDEEEDDEEDDESRLDEHQQQHQYNDSEIDIGDSGSSSIATDFSAGGKEYLSRSEIVRAYNKRATDQADKSRANGSDSRNNYSDGVGSRTSASSSSSASSSRDRKATAVANGHNSWSSRASSIMNNPESVYVSREEVLRNLELNNNHMTPERPPKNAKRAPAPPLPAKGGGGGHGSWSSRASSILASHLMLANGKPGPAGGGGGGGSNKEPHYMSRAELLERLADIAYDTLSNHSAVQEGAADSDGGTLQQGEEEDEEEEESDSDASTVKGVAVARAKFQQKGEEFAKQEERAVLRAEVESSNNGPAKGRKISEKPAGNTSPKKSGDGGGNFFGLNKMLARMAPFSGGGNNGSNINRKPSISGGRNKPPPLPSKAAKIVKKAAAAIDNGGDGNVRSSGRKVAKGSSFSSSFSSSGGSGERSRRSDGGGSGRSGRRASSSRYSQDEDQDEEDGESDLHSMCSCSSCQSYSDLDYGEGGGGGGHGGDEEGDYSCSCCGGHSGAEEDGGGGIHDDERSSCFYSSSSGASSRYACGFFKGEIIYIQFFIDPSFASRATVVGEDVMREEAHVANERREKEQHRSRATVIVTRAEERRAKKDDRIERRSNMSSSSSSHSSSSSYSRGGGSDNMKHRHQHHNMTHTMHSAASASAGRDKSNSFTNVSDNVMRRRSSSPPSSSQEVYVVNGEEDGGFASSRESVKSSSSSSSSSRRREKAEPWNSVGEEEEDQDDGDQPLYEPVDAREIHRQRQARALRRHLREIASDWDDRINDLNTLRRGRVLRQLKRFLRERVDFDAPRNEINRQVGALLRRALDSNFEAFSDLNVGQMYIPMEEVQSKQQQQQQQQQQRHQLLGGRRGTKGHHGKVGPSALLTKDSNNTDYDTFGSIDSLIFEPKIVGSRKEIKEAQEAIDKQFQYLNQVPNFTIFKSHQLT